jgi:hypothetical protein
MGGGGVKERIWNIEEDIEAKGIVVSGRVTKIISMGLSAVS